MEETRKKNEDVPGGLASTGLQITLAKMLPVQGTQVRSIPDQAIRIAHAAEQDPALPNK